MEGGDVKEFLECITFQEAEIVFRGRRFFFDAIDPMPVDSAYRFHIDLWNDQFEYVKTIFECTAKTKLECLNRFLDAPIWDGLPFWEAEKEMTWIEIGD